VTTRGGGTGEASAGRDFTLFEERLMQRVTGMRGYAPQTVATHAFGRIYGQGVMATAATFCLAVAKALVDTLRRTWPHATLSADENLPGTCGEFIGGSLLLDSQPVGWLLSINASQHGTGPNEDAEGCVPVGNKAVIMRSLGMLDSPIIMLEGKSFIPQLGDVVSETTILTRWNKDHDNPVVGECCARAAAASGLPCLVLDDTYPRMDNALEKNTRDTGEVIARLGAAYAKAQGAAEKIELAAGLARIVSEDMGGSIFMSNAVHQYAGNGGMWPGYGAMLSWTMSRNDIKHAVIPVIEDKDIQQGLIVLIEAGRLLIPRCAEAAAILHKRKPALTDEEINTLASVPAWQPAGL
jgi:hypothetical protein